MAWNDMVMVVVCGVAVHCGSFLSWIIHIDFYWVDRGEDCRPRFDVETRPSKICGFFFDRSLTTFRPRLFLGRNSSMFLFLDLRVFNLARRYQTLFSTFLSSWVQKCVYQSLAFVHDLQLLFTEAALGIVPWLFLIISDKVGRLWMFWVQSFGKFGLFVYKLGQQWLLFLIEFRIEWILLFDCVGQRKRIRLCQSLFVHFVNK